MKTVRGAWRDAGLILLMTLAATPFIAAQQTPSNAANRPVTAPRGGGPGDAIQVHGRWIIDVRNPDGTLASHHDFQNALLPAGQQLLSYLVSNAASIVTWDIRLRTSSVDGTGPCEPAVDADSSCYIVGPGSTLFPTLNLPNVFANGSFVRTAAGTLEISGHVTAAAIQEIGYVESIAEATGFGLTPFSGRTLATPIEVAIGQIVYVKVIVSFGETDPGGGGGGGALDSDGDGIPNETDACPNDANPIVNGDPTGCPATIYDINNGTVALFSFVRLTDVLVVSVLSESTIVVAVVAGDPTYQGSANSTLNVTLTDYLGTAALVGKRLTIDGTLIGSGNLLTTTVIVTSP